MNPDRGVMVVGCGAEGSPWVCLLNAMVLLLHETEEKMASMVRCRMILEAICHEE